MYLTTSLPGIEPCAPTGVLLRGQPLDRARDTLLRGTAYLHRHVAPRCDEVAGGAAAVHAPFVGNALGELDRFLNVLVDEVADWVGVPAVPAQHNTANKLRAFRVAVGEPDGAAGTDDGHARFTAIGRSRDYLKHASGRDATGAARLPSPPLSLSSKDLVAICRLYSDTAHDLHGVALALRPR